MTASTNPNTTTTTTTTIDGVDSTTSGPTNSTTTSTTDGVDATSRGPSLIAYLTLGVSLAAAALVIASIFLPWIHSTSQDNVYETKIGLFDVTSCIVRFDGTRVCETDKVASCNSINSWVCTKFETIKGLTITSALFAGISLSACCYLISRLIKSMATETPTPTTASVPVVENRTPAPKPIAVKDAKTGEISYVVPKPPAHLSTPTETRTSGPLSPADEKFYLYTIIFTASLVVILMLVAYFVGKDLMSEFEKRTVTRRKYAMGDGAKIAIGAAVAYGFAEVMSWCMISQLKARLGEDEESKA
ncbi:hypothetical protein BC829DRAFT_399036 [Chytridium lagenaria]|nr:hypothetical protein BC829DRAFT_399036 [Chytridium lagenaria]